MSFDFNFVEAKREDIKIRLAIAGPAGSGKTYTALSVASYLAKHLDLGDVYVIDSESGSSAKYAYSPRTGTGWKFKALYLPEDDQSPQMYIKALNAASRAGARICVVDSMTHAWSGANGVLQQVEQITARSKSKNAFSEGWNKMTPVQKELFNTILSSPMHIIATMRSKTEWVIDKDERGRSLPRKVGLAPEQRKDSDFEFDIVLDMDHDNQGTISKSRCHELRATNGGVYMQPGEKFASILVDWVRDCDPATEKPAATPPSPAVAVEGAKAVVSTIDRQQAAREKSKALAATFEAELLACNSQDDLDKVRTKVNEAKPDLHNEELTRLSNVKRKRIEDLEKAQATAGAA